MKRSAAVVIALASLALFTACGSDDDPEDTSPSTSTSSSSEDESSEPDEEESTEASGEATTLIAMVGTDSDPDAFEITLTDESGQPVESIPAGDYVIEVNDPSTMHNFHLVGGGVDETTTVDEVTEVTWEVTLEAGDYTFKCDPHPNMTGSFTVT